MPATTPTLAHQPGPQLPPGWMLESRHGIHLLLHPDQPVWCAVNDLGLEIARLADCSRSVGDLCARVADRLDAGDEEVRGLVERFLEQLERAGLLLSADSPAPAPRPTPPVRLEHLSLNVAGGCNLRCRHCAVIDGYAGGRQLARADLLRAIDQLAEIDCASVALTGGEPLTRRDLAEILEHAAGKVRVVLATNGTLITAELAARLARLGAAVEISVDGSRAEIHDRIRGRGAFDATMRGIAHLTAAGIAHRVTFTTTISRINLGDLEGIIALAECAGAGRVRFSPVQPIERAERHWRELGLTPGELRRAFRFLYREVGRRAVEIRGGFPGFVLGLAPGERWCVLGRTLAVDPEGDIYPCQLLQHPDYRLGNLHRIGLRQAVESPGLRRTIRDAAARQDTVEDCSSCHWRNFCQAGCPATVRWQKGTFQATDELCEARRELYRDVVFGLAEGREERAKPPGVRWEL